MEQETKKVKKVLESVFVVERQGLITDDYKIRIGNKIFTVKQVKDARRILTQRQRQAFDYRVVKGWKGQKTADKMGIAQPNVERYVLRSIEKMMAVLRSK